ncbi:arabinosyltransferase [Gordonia pseudamarae]|uniref:Arabinosyltransferase n=1 Tax=Gordonia pseudamarae TaxID=2831662 RepID=A0ABX6IRB5_9ACTN|nr:MULTISPECIES: arabinosyltransferase domain-containing protein [Gordonia]MBD0022243.1 arabinosyltransferase domain-containing protein [Gordonia sp. (in: high G+C Gram-positive bacteria)]QHN28883.1 arabinosyltransferase [Gordonia pseudamarae]QHN37754.1 arabinosyltransferase [Gordonia pseudamarae]
MSTAPTDDPAVPRLRLIALVAGLVGILACALTPLLPVTNTEATVTWPQGQRLGTGNASVSAPLIAQTPRTLDARIPCSLLAAAPATTAAPGIREAAGTTVTRPTIVLSTMPADAPGAKSAGLFVVAAKDTVTVTFRNNVAARATRADLARCSVLRIWSAPTGPGAQFVGAGPAATLEPDKRPKVTGIYSDLPTRRITAAEGLRVRVAVDNRYENSPSAIKLLVMAVAVLAVLVALWALWALDRAAGAEPGAGSRLSFPRLRSRALSVRRLVAMRPTDVLVTGTLVVWTFLGAGSPDDGYILNMGRTADNFGYLANYYRFYGIPEAPFDWYYAFLGHWSSVSTSLLWMHVPQLVAGLVSWFVLSRALLPRLGSAVAGGGWAVWAAALTFTAFWLPFASGLRSETVIVLGSLLVWWAAESAIATGRLFPAALAALTAGLTLGVAPQGVVGVAILLVAARPMLHVLLERGQVRREGRPGPDRQILPALSLAAPPAAAGMLVLVVMFREQTLATVYETIKIRWSVGPVIPWYQEFVRYYFVSVATDDGALARRVPLLLLLACLVVTVAVLLRRTSIQGLASGPVWRAIGGVGVTLILFAFTPTKWTIQFGVLAGLGTALAATATVAVVAAARSSTRNLTVFSSGLLFAMAAALAGYNAWSYVYDFDIAWFDRAPRILGVDLSAIALVLAVLVAALAAWQHLRQDYVRHRGITHRDDRSGRSSAQDAGDRRRLLAASTPIAVIAALIVLVNVVVFAKAAITRYPAPSVLSEHLNALGGNKCGLADDVLVETDPNAGMLTPADGLSATQALSGTRPVGFTPDGIPTDLYPKGEVRRPGRMNVDHTVAKAFIVTGGLGAGTTGGTGPTTVNGSTAALPFGLDPARTPVLGSSGYRGEARLTTGWYELPADRSVSPLLVFATAGAVSTVDAYGVRTFGQKLVVQFGKSVQVGNSTGVTGGFEKIGDDMLPIDPGPHIMNRPWRNLRVPMSAVPTEATAMRLSLLDNNLGSAQFIAITPPRAPRLRTLQQVVGEDTPTLIDFSAAAHFPCQRPLQVRHGVAEVPRWRILPDYIVANSQSKTWQRGTDGGLLGISQANTTAQAVPTYLKDDWVRDWGALERLVPFAPAPPAAKVGATDITQWGWSRTSSIRLEPDTDDDD